MKNFNNLKCPRTLEQAIQVYRIANLQGEISNNLWTIPSS